MVIVIVEVMEGEVQETIVAVDL
jgi:hypothetical protein